MKHTIEAAILDIIREKGMADITKNKNKKYGYYKGQKYRRRR